MSSSSIDISVIITVSDEGRLVHRSLRSAARAIGHARAQGIETELIAILDSPSAETLAYFEEHRAEFDVVEKVDLLDNGLSRNRGAELASGRYLAFLNADTLFSENWLTAAFRFAEAKAERATLVLHPEVNLCFGQHLYVVTSFDSNSDCSLEMMEFNPWTAMSLVPRSFFLSNQYAATRDTGFGNEHWHWNCETLAAGANHRLVPETVHFVRVGNDVRNTAAFRPSTLFDLPAQATAESSSTTTSAKNSSSVLGRARSAAIKFAAPRPDLLRFGIDLTRAARTYRAALARRPLGRLWLIEEWRRIHEIEPDTFPASRDVKVLEQRPVPRSAVAHCYPELYELIGPAPTHVYLLPWLKPGGADIESMYYMTAALTESRDSNVVCITTEDVESEWLSKLPKEIRVIEFGKLLRDFSEDERALLLLRLLLQKKPDVIHNINSAIGYKLFTEYGPALRSASQLFVSLFGVEFLPEGRLGGYAIWDLPHCINHLSGVITDSRVFADRLCNTYGFDRAKFSVVYVPGKAEAKGARAQPENNLNVLWASRMDAEKRLDVLYRIASEVGSLPVRFHVYGSPVYHSLAGEFIEKLKSLPNVTTYGAYDGFKSIPTENYDVFLYTSERDGLPNVLLEAMGAGLPVIAPDVGGIKELINEQTGFLMGGAEAVDEYVDALKQILSDYAIVTPKVEAATALVETRHSWNSFVAGLGSLPGYLR